MTWQKLVSEIKFIRFNEKTDCVTYIYSKHIHLFNIYAVYNPLVFNIPSAEMFHVHIALNHVVLPLYVTKPLFNWKIEH